MSAMNWQDALARAIAQYEALDAALLAFANDGGKQIVSVDTGQTRVSYQRSEVQSMTRARDSMLSHIAVLELRAGCVPGTYARGVA